MAYHNSAFMTVPATIEGIIQRFDGGLNDPLQDGLTTSLPNVS